MFVGEHVYNAKRERKWEETRRKNMNIMNEHE
jgi:hypothetical protein